MFNFQLTADFDYIFESTLTGFIVKEQDIREEFERNADDGKTLQVSRKCENEA